MKDLAALLYFCVLGAACGGASQPAQAPGVIQTVEDCYGCIACAKDLAERLAASKASDGGTMPAVGGE